MPAQRAATVRRPARGPAAGSWSELAEDSLAPVADDVVQIEMEGDGPLVVREKFHLARPMTIDGLLEIELVAMTSPVPRGAGRLPERRLGAGGSRCGVIRLVEDSAAPGIRLAAPAAGGLERAAGRTTDVASARAGRPVAVAGSHACVAGAGRRELDHTAPRIQAGPPCHARCPGRQRRIGTGGGVMDGSQESLVTTGYLAAAADRSAP